MPQTARRVLIVILINIIVVVLGLELLLRVIDPFGVWVYTIDVYRHNMQHVPHVTGYRLKTGVYDWASYDVTILPDGTRLVPASIDSDCTITTIGDSYTFGHSVNDDETFTNRLAERIPAHWLNTGRQGYAIDNMRRLQLVYTADGYIYLITDNDSAPPFYLDYPTHQPRALESYINWLLLKPTSPDLNYFMDTLARMDLERTLLIGFDHDPLATTAIATYGGGLIRADFAHVSRGDGHPNAAGHQQIADAMMPLVTDFVEVVCHA